MSQATTTDDTKEELIDALDELKELYQMAEWAKIPEPLERARHQAELLNDGDNDESENNDVREYLKGFVQAQDLYPREELHKRAFEDAADDLEKFGISTEEAEIRWLIVEDGVLHYEIEHQDIPRIRDDRHYDTEQI